MHFVHVHVHVYTSFEKVKRVFGGGVWLYRETLASRGERYYHRQAAAVTRTCPPTTRCHGNQHQLKREGEGGRERGREGERERDREIEREREGERVAEQITQHRNLHNFPAKYS